MESIKLVPALAIVVVAGCGGEMESSSPRTVPSVDLESYLGTWYEIARYPNRFQKGCTGSTASYSLRDDGRIAVVNTCTKGGRVEKASGKAWVVDTGTNAKLKVSFFWPFSGQVKPHCQVVAPGGQLFGNDQVVVIFYHLSRRPEWSGVDFVFSLHDLPLFIYQVQEARILPLESSQRPPQKAHTQRLAGLDLLPVNAISHQLRQPTEVGL